MLARQVLMSIKAGYSVLKFTKYHCLDCFRYGWGIYDEKLKKWKKEAEVGQERDMRDS